MKMKKWCLFALIAIMLLAVIMRLLPLFRYFIWGSDAGEYYYLTERLINQGYISFDYTGWGFGYPYFQGLFALTGAASLISSCNAFYPLVVIAPVLSGLSAVLIFLIAKNVFDDIRVGLISAFLYAIAIPHVFTTSHSMPGTLGDFLLLLSIFLFIKSYDNRKFVFLFFVSAVALVLTHHLSTYFLLITIALVIFMRELLRKNTDIKTLKTEILCFGFLFIISVIHWFYIAVRFKDIITDAFNIPAEIILVTACAGLFAMFLIVKIKRKFSRWEYMPKYPDYKKILCVYILTIGLGLAGLLFSVFIKFPGTTVSIGRDAILLFVPAIVVLSAAAAGVKFSDFYKKGDILFYWLAAVALSMLVGVATNNTVLIPYRHLQYFVVPVAIFAGVGIVKIIEFAKRKNIVRVAFACSFIFLLVLAPFSCYPPPGVLGGFEEGTPYEDANGIIWCENYLQYDTVASDHRMSSMLFGFSCVIPTWEYAPNVFHSGNFSDAEGELKNCTIPAGKMQINYVLVDQVMKSGVCLKQWEPAKPMSEESIAKFKIAPFIKIYDDGFVEVYKILWSEG